MKRNIVTLLILLAMLAGIVSSTSAGTSAVQAQNLEHNLSQSAVARVYYSDQNDLNTLAGRYDIIEVKKQAGYALILLSSDEFASLQMSGYLVEIDENKTTLLNTPLQTLPGQGPDSIPGYPCYRTVEETYADLESLAANNPDLTSMIDIGDSWDKATAGGNPGYDILALRLSNEDPQYGDMDSKPTYFLMAEIHARELVTAETATRYAEFLINNYGVDTDTTWLLDYFRVYIVAMTNPDGRKFAENADWWRKNVDNNDGCSDPSSWGVDLNRNYGFKWGCCGGSSGAPCDEVYRGPDPDSEPETLAIENFILTIFTDQRGSGDTDPAPADATGVMVTLHSAAGLVLWPWGWTSTDAPNASQLQTLGRRMASFNGYLPQQSNDLYTTDGTTDDWSYGELGIASFTIEMGSQFFEDCSSFEGNVYPDNLEVLKNVFKTARLPYMNPPGPETLSVAVTPAAAYPGDVVHLTGTANDTRFGNSGEPVQNIASARYSIDSPSWIPGTVTYPMTASDGTFNASIEEVEATIDTTGLTSGRHIIFIESKDANNNWGVTSAGFLYIVEPGVSPVIDGYVREASTNLPLSANVSAGIFNTTSDPSTGYYSMTVISGVYDMVAEAANFAPAYANGVVATDYQTTQVDFTLFPICSVFSDDVENGNLGWTPQSPWAITAEASHSPMYSWTDSPGSPYTNNRNISLTSPAFDLSDNTGVTLNFWHTYATEPGYDFGYVEYSTGGPWNVVTTYDGNQSWTDEQLAIPELDGEPDAQIRFRFTSDTNITEDGWHVDDISITAGGSACTPPLAPTAEFTSNSPVQLGQPMLFTNQTIGSLPMTYAWDFGDGTGTSIEQNPSYTYSDIGSYTVTLTSTNNLGSDSISHPVSVVSIDITGIDLTLISSQPIFIRDTVDFSADVIPDDASKPYDYTIDFGDGTIISNTSSLDPLLFEHAFTTGGSFTITVTTWNEATPVPVSDSLDIYVNYYRMLLPLTVK